jgi:hypothetical protein
MSDVPSYRFLEEFKEAFFSVPFGDGTNLHFPPGEAPLNLRLFDLFEQHPAARNFNPNSDYWDDDRWGYSPEDLQTIRSGIILGTHFLQEGVPDDEAWMALLEVNVNGEVYFLYIRAHCCYTGFGAAGGVHIYASRSIDYLRTMCMSPIEEERVFVLQS